MKASGRVVALNGDITAPQLGLSDDDLATLQGEVQLVIHMSADINLRKSVTQLAETNILGALAVAEVATHLPGLERYVRPLPLSSCPSHPLARTDRPYLKIHRSTYRVSTRTLICFPSTSACTRFSIRRRSLQPSWPGNLSSRPTAGSSTTRSESCLLSTSSGLSSTLLMHRAHRRDSTKNLAERLVLSRFPNLPTLIYRPSVIGPR